MAQWVEHQPGKLDIAGSNPVQGSSVFSLKLADCPCLAWSIYMYMYMYMYMSVVTMLELSPSDNVIYRLLSNPSVPVMPHLSLHHIQCTMEPDILYTDTDAVV